MSAKFSLSNKVYPNLSLWCLGAFCPFTSGYVLWWLLRRFQYFHGLQLMNTVDSVEGLHIQQCLFISSSLWERICVIFETLAILSLWNSSFEFQRETRSKFQLFCILFSSCRGFSFVADSILRSIDWSSTSRDLDNWISSECAYCLPSRKAWVVLFISSACSLLLVRERNYVSSSKPSQFCRCEVVEAFAHTSCEFRRESLSKFQLYCILF